MRDDNARRVAGVGRVGSYPARTTNHPQAAVVVVVMRADANMHDKHRMSRRPQQGGGPGNHGDAHQPLCFAIRYFMTSLVPPAMRNSR